MARKDAGTEGGCSGCATSAFPQAVRPNVEEMKTRARTNAGARCVARQSSKWVPRERTEKPQRRGGFGIFTARVIAAFDLLASEQRQRPIVARYEHPIVPGRLNGEGRATQ